MHQGDARGDRERVDEYRILGLPGGTVDLPHDRGDPLARPVPSPPSRGNRSTVPDDIPSRRSWSRRRAVVVGSVVAVACGVGAVAVVAHRSDERPPDLWQPREIGWLHGTPALGPDGRVRALAGDRKGLVLTYPGTSGTAIDVERPEQRVTPSALGAPVLDSALSPDGTVVVRIGQSDSSVGSTTLLLARDDTTSGRPVDPVRRFVRRGLEHIDLAVSDQATGVAVVTWLDGDVAPVADVWERDLGLVASLPLPGYLPGTLSISRDGARLGATRLRTIPTRTTAASTTAATSSTTAATRTTAATMTASPAQSRSVVLDLDRRKAQPADLPRACSGPIAFLGTEAICHSADHVVRFTLGTSPVVRGTIPCRPLEDAMLRPSGRAPIATSGSGWATGCAGPDPDPFRWRLLTVAPSGMAQLHDPDHLLPPETLTVSRDGGTVAENSGPLEIARIADLPLVTPSPTSPTRSHTP